MSAFARFRFFNAARFMWCASAILVVAAVSCTRVPRSVQGVAARPVQASRPPIPGAPPVPVAFVDVGVVPMDTERVLLRQTVLIQHGWITALGPSNQVQVPAGATRVDGRGQYLIPGLADMHVHLSWGRKIIRGGAAVDSAGAEQLMFLYLAQGVTTVRNMDHGESGPSIRLRDAQVLQLKARAAAGELLSPRIYTAGRWWPDRFGHWWRLPKDQRIRPESVATYVAAYKAAGYDHIKPYSETGPLFDSLVAAAHQLGLPLEGHLPVHNYTLERALVKDRYHSIEHLMGYRGIGNYRVERSDIDPLYLRTVAEAMKRAGVWNTPTLAPRDAAIRESFEKNLPVDTVDVWRHRGLLIRALRDAGAGLLLGTDAPVQNLEPGASVHRELQLLVKVGLTPYQALLTGTRNVAAFYNTLDSTGTVAVGKRADMVLIGGDPFQDIKHTTDPSGVMIGGRWLSREDINRRVGAP